MVLFYNLSSSFFTPEVGSCLLDHTDCMQILQVPADMEVAYIPCTSAGSYPGLFMATSPSRLLRPVKQLLNDNVLELIGPLEQVGHCCNNQLSTM